MSARAGELLFALATAELLEPIAPDVARRLAPWPDVTARTAADLLHGMESLAAHGATAKDQNVYLRRTCAQIIEHLGAMDAGTPGFLEAGRALHPLGGIAYPDGLRIASYTGPRPRATI